MPPDVLSLEDGTNLLLEDGVSQLLLEQQAVATGDFVDYIFRFPDQGAFQRDPVIQTYAPSVLGSQPGVQLLIYNPVETLNSSATTRNSLVLPPQQANSTVPLPGFWAMITVQGIPGPTILTGHPNLQILNDRTLMFAGQPSVIASAIDISHINIVINIYGVYVTDGLSFIPPPPPPQTFIVYDLTGAFLTNEQGSQFIT